MNWYRSWSKVCDSDRIVPSPSRSASGPWCWVTPPIVNNKKHFHNLSSFLTVTS
ncbi:hypothetical protein YC2023_081610 [Brassica napus]